MDFAKIASRIAASRTFRFQGEVYTEMEGENNSGQGDLAFDGKTHKVEFSTGGRDMSLTIDGKNVDPEQDTELYNDVENFLTLNFPYLDDERWEEDPEAGSADDENEFGEDVGSDAMKMPIEVSGPAWP